MEHTEYQKVQSEQQKAYEINNMSMSIRDRIISTYRQEIESNKLNERDFVGLKAQIEDLKRRKQAYDISFTSFQGDFEAQIHSQENVIASLHNELDVMKQQNNERTNETQEVSEQIRAVRIEIEHKETEIRELNQEMQTVIMKNQGVERENENQKYQISEN